MNRRAIGGRFEEKAAAFLQEKGLDLLARNYRCRLGEIDLIAREGDTLVFVEVKYRKTAEFGFPEAAVDPAKQRRIRRVAQWYLAAQGLPEETACRFDVVALEGGGALRHYRDAFGGL